eukprot:scaffold18130_cov32-Tisochrysis_lutea.AAC.2
MWPTPPQCRHSREGQVRPKCPISPHTLHGPTLAFQPRFLAFAAACSPEPVFADASSAILVGCDDLSDGTGGAVKADRTLFEPLSAAGSLGSACDVDGDGWAGLDPWLGFELRSALFTAMQRCWLGCAARSALADLLSSR